MALAIRYLISMTPSPSRQLTTTAFMDICGRLDGPHFEPCCALCQQSPRKPKKKKKGLSYEHKRQQVCPLYHTYTLIHVQKQVSRLMFSSPPSLIRDLQSPAENTRVKGNIPLVHRERLGQSLGDGTILNPKKDSGRQKVPAAISPR